MREADRDGAGGLHTLVEGRVDTVVAESEAQCAKDGVCRERRRCTRARKRAERRKGKG